MGRMIDHGDLRAELTVLPDEDETLMAHVDEHVSNTKPGAAMVAERLAEMMVAGQ